MIGTSYQRFSACWYLASQTYPWPSKNSLESSNAFLSLKKVDAAPSSIMINYGASQTLSQLRSNLERVCVQLTTLNISPNIFSNVVFPALLTPQIQIAPLLLSVFKRQYLMKFSIDSLCLDFSMAAIYYGIVFLDGLASTNQSRVLIGSLLTCLMIASLCRKSRILSKVG